ncbi:hypothetical protein EGW08_013637 [Elysia chlorotica]|uniref:Uncharacterized protein n=1 Tax=Elysia chlorotica TaxID=188477 RepID=A0A3S0ZGU1_ELYCH|nr:hypothetical protein EGW08_013637 [Elysia chlorotica]
MIPLGRARSNLAGLLLYYWLLVVVTERDRFALAAGAQSAYKDASSQNQPEESSIQVNDAKNVPAPTHYGILLDAGSSSTKSKIYRWTPPMSPKTLPVVQLLKTSRFKPALATFGNDEQGLTDYLSKILSAAKQIVPETEHSMTPISIMATAGFRFMSGPSVQSLLHLTRSVMSNSSINPFHFSETVGVAVLSGEEEGVYSWIAANYLNGFFDYKKKASESVGVLEMGGGSTQITFLPNGPLYAEEFHVTVAGRQYDLYVQSYLQFGVDGIRTKVAHYLAEMSPGLGAVGNPCMLRDDTSVLNLTEHTRLTMEGTGNPAKCEEMLTQILKPYRGNRCHPKPCAIGSVYQPELPNITFYATQAFTYAPNNLRAVGSNKVLDIDRLRQAAFHHCNRSLDEAETESNMNRQFASDDCMTALYMSVLLTTSYGFKRDTSHIKVTSKLEGQYIDWALGAMLMDISSMSGDKTQYSVTCKPKTSVAPVKDKNLAIVSTSLGLKLLILCSLLSCFYINRFR